MNKKNGNNDFKHPSNEKQNSLASGIRIGSQGNFPVLKQQFVKIKEVEYSTDFNFFLKNQMQVVVCKDNSYSVCSTLEKRVFYKGFEYEDDSSILNLIERIHCDIISFKYGGEHIY